MFPVFIFSLIYHEAVKNFYYWWANWNWSLVPTNDADSSIYLDSEGRLNPQQHIRAATRNLYLSRTHLECLCICHNRSLAKNLWMPIIERLNPQMNRFILTEWSEIYYLIHVEIRVMFTKSQTFIEVGRFKVLTKTLPEM